MKVLGIVLFVLVSMFVATDLSAQCAMCKANADASNASGFNAGILYMLSLPYVMIGTIGYFWWRNRQQIENAEQEAEVLKLLKNG
jgi:hypothetical protein